MLFGTDRPSDGDAGPKELGDHDLHVTQYGPHMYEHGWFQVAFERDLRGPLTAATAEGRRFVLVDDGRSLRAFGADCPHRGAHLALGGRLDGSHVVCPFHGYRIGLGHDAGGEFATQEYPTLVSAGMVFVRLSDEHENGLGALLTALAGDHVIVPAFEMAVRAPAELVIENGFDRRHFTGVHRVLTGDFTVSDSESGALIVVGTFQMRPGGQFRPEPGESSVTLGYRATTISPGLVVVAVTGSNPYTFITAATPTQRDECLIRLTLCLPTSVYGRAPTEEQYGYLLRYSRAGLEQDRMIWENVSPAAPNHLTPDDEPIVRFHAFCARFRASDAG